MFLFKKIESGFVFEMQVMFVVSGFVLFLMVLLVLARVPAWALALAPPLSS